MKIEWVHKKLGECCDRICNGLTYDVEETQGYLVTRIETISDGYIDYNKIGHINDKPNQDYLMVNGDILFSHINSVKHIGKVAYYDDSTELYHGMNLLLLRANNSIDKLFLFYLLSSDKYRRKIRTLAKSAVNQASISTTDLGKFELSYPNSLPAQRHIAAILSSADKVIASTQKVIAKYKQMKQGLMEDLLKPKEGWKKVKLGECCEINPKTDTTKVQDYDVVAFIRMEDVSNDGFITSFSERAYKSLQKKGFTVFQNDDVIFAKITPCMENGKGGLVRNMKSKICMGSTEFHVLRACANVSTDFIYQLTISKRFRQKAEMQMTGSAGQQRVPAAFLEDYFISIPFKNDVPDLAEQRRIAAILSGIDAKIAAEEKVLEKYEKIKKGMMERMLEE